MLATDEYDPFACFGDGSSSSDDDNHIDDDALINAPTNDLEEAHRLRDKSNAERPSALTDMLHEHRASFEMFDATPLSGRGIRATVAYKRGDEIMRERAVMRVPKSQAASSPEAAQVLHRNAIQRAYNSMHKTSQQSFMALSSCNEDGIDVVKTPQGVYDTNSYCLGNDPDCGVFLTICRINHSCRPNANHFWSPNLQKQLIIAARDIGIGEELFTTYGPNECMDTKSRREYLNERFSFVCNCEMCLEGNSNGGDERMIKIQALQEDIVLQSSTANNVSAGLDSIAKCLALMKEQGISGGSFTKSIYHHGHDICLAAGDHKGAKSYLNNELAAVRDSEGVDSPKAIEIEQVLNHFHAE